MHLGLQPLDLFLQVLFPGARLHLQADHLRFAPGGFLFRTAQVAGEGLAILLAAPFLRQGLARRLQLDLGGLGLLAALGHTAFQVGPQGRLAGLGIRGRLLTRLGQGLFRLPDLFLQHLHPAPGLGFLGAGLARHFLQTLHHGFGLLQLGRQLALLLLERGQFLLQPLHLGTALLARLIHLAGLLVERATRLPQGLLVLSEFTLQFLHPRRQTGDLGLGLLVPALAFAVVRRRLRSRGRPRRGRGLDRQGGQLRLHGGGLVGDPLGQLGRAGNRAFADQFTDGLEVERAIGLARPHIQHPQHLQISQVVGREPVPPVGRHLVVGGHAALAGPRGQVTRGDGAKDLSVGRLQLPRLIRFRRAQDIVLRRHKRTSLNPSPWSPEKPDQSRHREANSWSGSKR